MTSSSPRSVPAGCSATSRPPTGRSGSPSRCGSATRPKPPPPSRYATANPRRIGFYLDNQRIHVGDLSTITEEVFAAWQHDRSTGLDSIMLAPTRELVAQLNQRARTHRLADTQPDTDPEVTLADGNRASVGELIITRSNDRQLRLTATDWVKNGDRWTVQAITAGGDLDVQHLRNRHRVRLPAGYVQTSAELGYATTVHAAQGLSVDTMHGLATGEESRQQLYTMLTRGRAANHLYLQVVGDGDPHSIIWPETVRPSTPTDLLEQILARDDAARSATTLQRDQHDPAARLADATRRYVDALYVAAEDLAGPQAVAALEKAAEQAVPGLADEPAWPSAASPPPPAGGFRHRPDRAAAQRCRHSRAGQRC